VSARGFGSKKIFDGEDSEEMSADSRGRRQGGANVSKQAGGSGSGKQAGNTGGSGAE
jgi:hypothetical protein